MQKLAPKQQATSTRRPSRLAKNSRDAPAASTPVLPLPEGNSPPLRPPHPPPSPTIASTPILNLDERKESQASVEDLKASNRFMDVRAQDADKENMESFLPQLADRIKQNRRQATKRPYTSDTQPKRKSKQHPLMPSQSSAVMSASLTESAQLRVPAQSGTSDLTTSPLSTPALPAPDSVLPGSDARQQPSDVLNSSSCVTLAEDVSDARRSRTPKRDAELDCDSEPPAKRSRSASSPIEEVVGDINPILPGPPSESPEPQRTIMAATDACTSMADKPGLGRPPTASSFTETIPDTAPLPLEPEASSRAEQDISFIEKVQKSLAEQSKRKEANVGKRQARRILQLLKLAKSPDRTEALFLSGEEAKAQLEANQYFPGPIFTEGQQPLDLQTIDGFLDEHYVDDSKVFIQDPGTKINNGESVREITIGKLKEHFARNEVVVPYNCLELAAHVEDGLRPAFLNNEDCRLLTKLKHPSSEDHASRRNYAPGWKEVEKWALLARAGALTEPHQDSHGYSTFITVNQGIIGFGWLSNPTADQRTSWHANPSTFTGGNWRYTVLRPGQTVFFPSGTVHFVFRHTGAGDTLAFGGHVLRCSQIVRWARTLLEEQASDQITNEEMSVSAPEYLRRVELFVRQAKAKGQERKWGGVEAVQEFLRLKGIFDEREAARG